MMGQRTWAVRSAAFVAVAGSVAGSAVGSAWLGADARRLALSPEPQGLLLAAVETAAALLLVRCGLGGALTLAAVTQAPARRSGAASRAARAAVRLTPRLLRPAVSAALAVGLVAVASGPALASPRSPDLPAAAWVVSREVPAPTSSAQGPTAPPRLPAAGWVPSPRGPAPAAAVGLVAGAAHRGTSSQDVVVRRGDSLWAIVARTLGPHATNARIAAEWPRWYAANRTAIGADPDVLQPGTTLHSPARTGTR